MTSKTIRTVWYCPCSCRTPKGLLKKFYKNNKLIEHILIEHADTLETKFLYRDKLTSHTSSKKRTFEESEEDGYKELLSVEEEEEDEKIEADIDELTAIFTDKNSIK